MDIANAASFDDPFLRAACVSAARQGIPAPRRATLHAVKIHRFALYADQEVEWDHGEPRGRQLGPWWMEDAGLSRLRAAARALGEPLGQTARRLVALGGGVGPAFDVLHTALVLRPLDALVGEGPARWQRPGDASPGASRLPLGGIELAYIPGLDERGVCRAALRVDPPDLLRWDASTQSSVQDGLFR